MRLRHTQDDKRHYSLPNKEKLHKWLCSRCRRYSFQLHRKCFTSIYLILFVRSGEELHQIETDSFTYYSDMPFQHVVLEQNLQCQKVSPLFSSQKQSSNSKLNTASPHVAWHVMCFSPGGDPGPDILEGRYCPFPVKCQHTEDVIMQTCKFYSGAQ